MLLQIQEIELTIAIGSVVIIFFTVIIIVTITQYKQRAYKHLLETEQLKTEFSKTLLQSRLEIREQTLQNIGHEIHDNIGQIASLIKIHLNTLQLDDTLKSREKVEEIKDLTRQLITDLKTLSVSLNGDRIAQLGIVRGLQGEVDRLNKTGLFEARMKVEGSPPALDSNTAIILFRMGQELINNVVKHSQAKQVIISATTTEKLLTLGFCDNGVGFDPDLGMLSGGSGLLNLRNRARLINASLSFESKPGEGSRIAIELPL